MVELNQDGTPQLDANGDVIETYDNDDITEMAKVFTGLWWEGEEFRRGSPTNVAEAMPMTDEYHSKEAKNLLGMSIPKIHRECKRLTWPLIIYLDTKILAGLLASN